MKNRILIVDDEQVILRLMARAFKDSGHELVFAESVTDALRKLKEADFDLLVTDLRMPDGNGTEVVRRFHEKHPMGKIIIMTGSLAPDKDLKAVADIQLCGFMAKPFDLDVMRSIVDKALAT